MKSYKAKELISRYRQGIASPEERRLVEQWFLIDLEQHNLVPDQETFERTDEKISANLAKHIEEVRPGGYKLWPRIIGIAAAVAAIVICVFLFRAPRHPDLVSGSQVANDVKPGHNGATLTLGNGKVINLSDAKTGVVMGGQRLIYNDNTAVIAGGNSEEGKITLSTAKGQTYQITLPDGTKVWLNAASSLTYTPPRKDRGMIRSVKLVGEAYFEVFPNKKQLFRVNFGTSTLQVLGTHFNVNAYPDDQVTKATLLEGRISVEKLFLKPNEQAVMDHVKRQIYQQTVTDAERTIAWTDVAGKPTLIFDDDDLDLTMRKVSRWYDVDIENRRTKTNDIRFSGVISRDRNLSSVITLLEATEGIHLKIEGRRLIIMD